MGYTAPGGSITMPYGSTTSTAVPAGGGQMAAVAIPAAATVAGAAISAQGGKAAAKASERTADKALAYQRDVDKQRREAYAAAMRRHEAQWGAWNANRMALLNRYGVDIGQGGGSAPVGGGGFPSAVVPSTEAPRGSREAVPAYTNTMGGLESADARGAYYAWNEAGRPPAGASIGDIARGQADPTFWGKPFRAPGA